MRTYIMLSFLILILIQNIISLDSNTPKFIKMPFTDEYSIPTINTFIENKKIETILDNNLNSNYLSTKYLNLSDLDYNHRSEKIIFNNKMYDAYYSMNDITIFDEKKNNSIELNNFESYIIDDKSLLSSITVSYILKELKAKSKIDKKKFYFDMNNKKCIFGELPKESDEYKQIFDYDKYIHSTFYSHDAKGVLKEELVNFYIDNTYYQVDNNVTFNINEKYSYIPYSIFEEIKEKITNLNCELVLIDPKGVKAIKCPIRVISKLPELFLVFKNYTFTIPLRLLFESYDNTNSISLFRNNIKDQHSESSKEKKEESNADEWVIGYSIIKNFNYIVFDYEEGNVSFYSDYLVRLYPPNNVRKIYKNIFYFLIFILGIASVFLILILIYIKRIPLDAIV